MTFYIPLDKDFLVTSFKTLRRARFAALNTFNTPNEEELMYF